MNIIREKCAICNKKLENIFSIEKVPIKAICVEDIIDNISNKLSFSVCVECNTIQLDELIPLHILYSVSHNIVSVGNVWKKYFDLFLEKLHPIIQNRQVLEIGCPSGKIAMNTLGFKKYCIIDPNKNDTIIFSEKNISFIHSFFDKDFVCDFRVDVIVHSHLFEHIYEPNNFLQKCHEILCEDGEMFFGVPNMSYFIETNTCPFLGVYFEHTIFLNKNNIVFLLEKNGFKIIEIINYEKHSVIYHCKKIKITEPFFEITNYENFKTPILDNFNKSIEVYKHLVQKTNEIITQNNQSSNIKKIYIFGASYYSQILLSMGIDAIKLNGVLDNCVEKQNKFLYGVSLMVYSPQILANEDCIVILKNGYYCEEIYNQIKVINPNTIIIS